MAFDPPFIALHKNLQSALTVSRLPHSHKAAILFQEAIAELKTGAANGELGKPSDAASALTSVASAIQDEAASL